MSGYENDPLHVYRFRKYAMIVLEKIKGSSILGDCSI